VSARRQTPRPRGVVRAPQRRGLVSLAPAIPKENGQPYTELNVPRMGGLIRVEL
jgi:hypothetical protein